MNILVIDNYKIKAKRLNSCEIFNQKMKKIIVIFLLIFLIGCGKIFSQKTERIFIDNGKEWIELNVEIADDSEERSNGLMFREKLEENKGIIFIFDDENYQSFWMKNTLIPLDMIFVSKNLEIVDVKTAVPCKNDPCTLYKPSKPAKYVIEANAGFAAKNSINDGDKLIPNNKYINKP